MYILREYNRNFVQLVVDLHYYFMADPYKSQLLQIAQKIRVFFMWSSLTFTLIQLSYDTAAAHWLNLLHLASPMLIKTLKLARLIYLLSEKFLQTLQNLIASNFSIFLWQCLPNYKCFKKIANYCSSYFVLTRWAGRSVSCCLNECRITSKSYCWKFLGQGKPVQCNPKHV